MADPRPDGPLGVLGAVGGGLGILPLVAVARSLATRVFPLPDLPGAERLTRDVKQATYFEIAVLLVFVPAAAIFFSRILPAFLESRGQPARRAYLAGAGFGGSFLLWRGEVSAVVSLGIGLAFAAAIVCAPWLRRSRVAAAIIFLALFLGGVFGFYRPLKRLDLFEDGMILFGASSLATGARPYLDVYPVHGWGADGGMQSIFFRYVNHDLVAYQLLKAALSALALAFLAAASFLFFRDFFWGLAGLAACLAFCPFTGDRHVPALIAYGFLIAASRSESSRNWIWAGVVTGATLFVTLDFGILMLVGGLVAPLVLSLGERKPVRRALPPTLRFAAGFLLGCLPFAAFLAARGALGEFLRVSFLEIPQTITQTWGFPAESLTRFLREGSLFHCFNPFLPRAAASLCVLLLVLILAVALLWIRSADRVLDSTDRAVAVCVIIAIIALRGVFGRADVGHQMIYGVFAGLPAAWLLFCVWHSGSRFRPVLAAGATAAFLLFLRPDFAMSALVRSIAGAREARRNDVVAATPFGGPAFAILERKQAKDLEPLRRVIDGVVPPGKTFFDFGNEPGLYFLLGRRPSTRYCCVASYQTDEKQREVIADLERQRPPVAILSSGTATDAFDSVPNRDRAPLVARYLDTHYRVVGKVGPRTVGVWKGPPRPWPVGIRPGRRRRPWVALVARGAGG